MQLAQLAGARVVAVTGSALKKLKLEQELGVERVINYKEEVSEHACQHDGLPAANQLAIADWH